MSGVLDSRVTLSLSVSPYQFEQMRIAASLCVHFFGGRSIVFFPPMEFYVCLNQNTILKKGFKRQLIT